MRPRIPGAFRHRGGHIGFPGLLLAALLAGGCSRAPVALRWESLGGPSAQNVTTLLPLGAGSGRLLAGLAEGGILLSTDGGLRWKELSAPGTGGSVRRLLPHPDDPSAVLAATASGLLRSDDGGQTWTTLLGRSCGAAAVDPYRTSTILAGTDSEGIMVSGSGGELWSPARFPPGDQSAARSAVRDIRGSAADPNLFFAALDRAGIARSTDGGASWHLTARDLAASGTVFTCVLPHPLDPAVVCFGTARGEIYRSASGGESWSPTRRGTGVVGISGFAAGPGNPDHLLAGTEAGIILSEDFGRTWRTPGTGLARVPSAVFAQEGNPGVLYVSGQGLGVKRSTDGGWTWHRADAGLGGSSPRRLLADPSGDRLYCSVGSAVYRRATDSGDWEAASDGLAGGEIASLVLHGDSLTLLAGTPGGLYRSTDGGDSWTWIGDPPGEGDIAVVEAHPFISTRLYTGRTRGFQVSTDRGESWRPAQPYGLLRDVHALRYAPRNAGILHGLSRSGAVFGSSDGGLTWESRRYGIRDSAVMDLAYGTPDARLLYAWSPAGAGYRSSDGGVVWEPYTPPWTGPGRVLLAVCRMHPQAVAAIAGDRRVFISDNGGGTWLSFLTEPPGEEILSLEYSPARKALYAGTRGRGVYRLNLEDVLPPDPDDPARVSEP
ncbi:MAG: hypothetical protein WB626_12355 [Bacteroidota bacterium]